MTTRKTDWVDWIKTLLIAILMFILIRMFIAIPIIVEGPSMLPTLENGERLIVDKLTLTFEKPERFDIVVFHATSNKDYIKRVIGLPGEAIEYRDDILYVDGKPIEESFLDEVKSGLSPDDKYTTDFSLVEIPNGQLTVPEDHLFVLGDNRNNSTDSRHLGFIPLDEVTGIARLTYWPVNDIEIYY
ncbi:signal peptidase I [Gracilibacillus marinus]|uniref:Signal peptidase I n=1 Tax=Gracilibacillus marinus TaxID=630535 RepID=A0ABV8VUZ6_9BACI